MNRVINSNYSSARVGLSTHKLFVSLLMITAVFGYVVGYGKLYAFHLVLASYWGFVLVGIISIRKKTIKAMAIPVSFLLFMCISLLWTPNVKNGLSYIFYFLCGYTIVFAIVNYASGLARLNFIFRVLAIFFIFNFAVGLLETTGYFRLPVSPYYGLSSTRPSGFNSNLNNFGFVFVAIFPFIVLYPMRLLRLLGAGLALWFVIKLESKGFLLGLVAFLCFYFFAQIKKKSTWRWAGLGLIASSMLSMILFFGSSQISLDNRAFSAFSQIERGVSLISSGYVTEVDSTSKRAAMYLMGVKELHATNGMGLGVAGIGSKLALNSDFFDEGKEFYSFHNFFLEMLVDLGVIPFVFIMYFYIRLALYNIKMSNRVGSERLRFFNKASGVSLLTIIPASISPSSIIYVFTFWLVIGFAVATYLVTRGSKMSKCNSVSFSS